MSDTISYGVRSNGKLGATVWLGKRLVGVIAEAPGGFRYIPSRFGLDGAGETFPSIEAVKRSIEGES